MSWGEIGKGGAVLVMRRDDALEAGMAEPLTEELLLVVSIEGEEGQAVQCSRARLAEILRNLAPKRVQMFRPDPEMEAAVRAGRALPSHGSSLDGIFDGKPPNRG